jgi:O-6-methylguanine DNA methyltransferase
MKENRSAQTVTIPTSIGRVELAWTLDGGRVRLVGINLSEGLTSPPRRKSLEKARVPLAIKRMAAAMQGGLEDIPGRTPDGLVDWGMFAGFQGKVYKAVRRIPRGKVSSYGDIARRAGSPRAARAVGHAMAVNSFPLLIPCHRVVRADGSLGGFTAGLSIKEKLLKLEGVTMNADGRIRRDDFWS